MLLIINVTPSKYLFSSHSFLCYIHVFIFSKHYIGTCKMSYSQKILYGIAHDIHKYAELFCCLLLKNYYGNTCLQQQRVAKQR